MQNILIRLCRPAVWYLVASLINGDTLAVITSELPRVACGHLDVNNLGAEWGGAWIIFHFAEVELIHSEQHRILQRVAETVYLKEDEDVVEYAPGSKTCTVLLIIPVPQLGGLIEDNAAGLLSVVDCVTLLWHGEDVDRVKHGLWAEASHLDVSHLLVKSADWTVGHSTFLEMGMK